MTEFDLLCRMIRARFHEGPGKDGCYRLYEGKEAQGKAAHIVKAQIIQPVQEVALFKFELDNFDFLPFFADPRSPQNGPRHLKSFCDYIMLAHDDKELHIILIEMKRAKEDPDMTHQFAATETFMRYVLDSAERIKDHNDSSDFDRRRIGIRKVCLKQYPGLRCGGNIKEQFLATPADQIVKLNNCPTFHPHWTF